jgi:Protein of unknown function (DUF3037)
MQEQHLFEYAVIRIVPRVEREEFLNVGIILLCSPKKFLLSRISVDESRLHLLCPSADMQVISHYIKSFESVCNGGPDAGPIGVLPIAERFRWLTASRSTMIQTSSVHPGLCDDPDRMLKRLFDNLVLIPSP